MDFKHTVHVDDAHLNKVYFLYERYLCWFVFILL